MSFGMWSTWRATAVRRVVGGSASAGCRLRGLSVADVAAPHQQDRPVVVVDDQSDLAVLADDQ